MKSLTKKDKDRLSDLGVGVVYLFGSAAHGIQTASSDVDIGIVMSDPKMALGNTMPMYSELFELLGELVKDSNKLDIVFLQRAPLELRFDAIKNGRPLYEATTGFRLDFEESVTKAYCDFRPILREFDEAIIGRAA